MWLGWRIILLVFTVILGGMVFFIASDLTSDLSGSTGEISRRAVFMLKAPIPLVVILISLRSIVSHEHYRDMALGASLGGVVLILWTLFDEAKRLFPYAEEMGGLQFLIPFVDLYMIAGNVVAGMFVYILYQHFRFGSGYNRKGRAKPKRSKNAVHGDADFMKMNEVKRLFPDGNGVVIGEAYRPDLDTAAGDTFRPEDKNTWGKGGKTSLLTFDSNFGSTHGLIFAGSGGFKTTAIVVPTTLKWTTNMVVLDPSREVGPMVKNTREAMGQNVYTLNPDDKNSGFNVLDWILDSDSPEENIAATVKWLFTENSSSSSSSEDFFQLSAAGLVQALLAHILLDGTTPTKNQNLRYLKTLLTKPVEDLLEVLKEAYDSSNHDFVRESCGPFCDLVEATFSGIYATANKETQWLSFQRLGNLVSTDGVFETKDLQEVGTDIFINIDLKTLRTHPGLGRVIIGSLMNSIYEADGNIEGRTLFLIDEADTLGKMDIIKTARDAGRKYGISLCLVYQSIGQLIENWGQEAKSQWFESTSYRIFAAINDQKTADELSKMCGEYTVDVKNKSKSSGRQGRSGLLASGTSNTSRTTQVQKRSLILPHEIMQDMRSDEQLVFVTNQPPIRTGRAIYFRRNDMVSKVKSNRFSSTKGKEDEGT